MRTLYSFLTLLALLLPATAGAQTLCTPHPTESAAVLIGNFTTHIILAKQDREVTGHTNICVFRNGAGKIDYVINVTSIQLEGEWEAGDDVPTLDLFEHFSRAAVAQGVAKGFSPCTSTGTNTARVLAPACVQRTGSGVSTKFAPSGSLDASIRTYSISCPNGPAAPVITLLPAAPTTVNCMNGCERTGL